jgi:hypothetical protein
MSKKGVGRALIKFCEIKRPYSAEIIGTRIKAAIPNLAGRNWAGEAVPSFAKKYLIEESSDMSSVTDKYLDQFLDRIRGHGYNEFVLVGKKD